MRYTSRRRACAVPLALLLGPLVGCSSSAEPTRPGQTTMSPSVGAGTGDGLGAIPPASDKTESAAPAATPEDSAGAGEDSTGARLSLAPAAPAAPPAAGAPKGPAPSSGTAAGEPAAGGAGGMTNSTPVESANAGSSATAMPLADATLWLAGDSTVQTYAPGNTQGANGSPLEGWGQEIGQFFKSQLLVSNDAIGGRSIAFFMWSVVRDAAGTYQCVDDQGNPQFQLDAAGNRVDTSQWARIKAGIKAGDFLLIQFGTNDETHDCPRFVNLTDFQADLAFMVDTVRAKGATPIFVTPMSHRSFQGAAINNTLLPYANAMKTEAALVGVDVVDLNLRSVEYFNSVGNAFLETNIFDGGTTHFIAPGAVKMAELISGEIRANGGALAAYLQ